MHTLVFLRSQFEQILSALLRQPHAVAVSRAGRNRMPAGTELLGRDFSVVRHTEAASADGDRVIIVLARTNAELRDGPRTWLPALPDSRARALTALLAVGIEAARGQLSGAILTERGDLAPLDTLKLIGPEMYQFPISHFPFPISQCERERWSRTMGALDGEEGWQRIVSLRCAVIGVGRTGSLVATTLARLGVRDLTLIDPDVVEAHNLGEMDAVTDAHLGQPKVEAVAECLRPTLPLPHCPPPPCYRTRVPRRPQAVRCPFLLRGRRFRAAGHHRPRHPHPQTADRCRHRGSPRCE